MTLTLAAMEIFAYLTPGLEERRNFLVAMGGCRPPLVGWSVCPWCRWDVGGRENFRGKRTQCCPTSFVSKGQSLALLSESQRGLLIYYKLVCVCVNLKTELGS